MELKPIQINREAKIICGPCSGISGKVISADWETKKITIQVSSVTTITTEWPNVEQI